MDINTSRNTIKKLQTCKWTIQTHGEWLNEINMVEVQIVNTMHPYKQMNQYVLFIECNLKKTKNWIHSKTHIIFENKINVKLNKESTK
jgi:uncharacterized pyridoxamine 5'-phosphate oxidase family protein